MWYDKVRVFVHAFMFLEASVKLCDYISSALVYVCVICDLDINAYE